MKLIDALEILKQPSVSDAPVFRVFLATGFTPLHLQTFLAAHLRNLQPQNRVEVRSGLFGDLAGNVERIQPGSCDVLAIALEWQDLDARLGFRNLGGWRAQELPDIVKSAERALARLEQAIRKACASYPMCMCLPTLPLPPLFTNSTHQSAHDELLLRSFLASFAAAISEQPLVRIVSADRLNECSAAKARLDLKADLSSGFPYQLDHACAVAEALAHVIHNPAPKKGLITDLDDTLWAGILGEVGVEGVSWDLDKHTHVHGLYQQLLSSLAAAGILIGVASKNDPVLVERAFERRDVILRKEQVFPIEVHWSPKSESVARILKAWNIGAETVVFVDDSPMELAEVRAAFPEMEGVLFKPNDYDATWDLLRHLRDRFGKTSISQEDALRVQSLRSSSAFRDSGRVDRSASLDDFLRDAGARIHLSFEKQPPDQRAFELINKTNQFNLNGNRITDAAWIEYLSNPSSFLMTVIYEDKYGPLGKIAVILGKKHANALDVDFWVMSCRAFSRRIEHQCLKQLFESFDVREIYFEYQSTPRNGPLQQFFATLLGGAAPQHDVRLAKGVFFEKCPPLFHHVSVKEAVHA